MKRSAYRDRDYAFGERMLTLRNAIGITQEGLADYLGISRSSVGAWESGSKYPNFEHLKELLALAVERKALPAGREADEIRSLWKASQQKTLLNETWLEQLLADRGAKQSEGSALSKQPPANRPRATINLPFQTTSFVGRSSEITEITRIVGNPACRLLTLLGPGGVGKTRLALEVAASQSDRFADGVVFVPLASIAAPSQIASAIGDSLKLSFEGHSDPTAFLLDYLHDRYMMLVLDNFEHLLDGIDLIRHIIQRSRNITLLVTSRVRLELQGEWLFDVEGLSYPLGSVTNPLQVVTDYSAVQLFVQRIVQVQPRFALSEASLRSIVNVSQQLAGMPLAIELAAAGVRTHSIGAIEKQINGNLSALSTTLRDVPERHRSMRAAFNHSWSLLDETERTLFSRLAIFHGSFTEEAAQQIADATLVDLGNMMDKSLLRQFFREPDGSESRFMMLEPIREYAMEMQLERGENEKLQHAHAAYYVTLAENAGAHWYTPTAETAMKILNTEYDNLYAALVWSRVSHHPTMGLQIAIALTPLWKVRSFLSEGALWLAELLQLDAENQDATGLAVRVRVRALRCAARLATDLFDFAEAARLLKESLAIRHVLGETGNETRLLINATLQARSVGEYQRAITLIEDALAEHVAQGERGGIAECLYILALVLREQGNLDRALALIMQRLEIDSEIGDPGNKAQALLALGDIARDRGDVIQTRKYTSESLTIFREYGMQWAIGFALNNLAYAAYMAGELSLAFSLSSESVSLFRNINRDTGLAESLVTWGNVLRAQGELAAAHDALMEALRLAWANGPRLFVAYALEGLAGVMLQSNQAPLGVRFLSASSMLRTKMVVSVRPSDQAMVEATGNALELAVGERAFETMWLETQEQPLERFIASFLND